MVMGIEKESDTTAATSGTVTDFVGQIDNVVEELGLPFELFTNLKNEDDWSFVIKVHTVVEAALSSLLIYALKDERVSLAVNSLPLANRRYGKLAFAKQLDLLSDNAQAFVAKLALLRNSLAHRVGNVTFTFTTSTGPIKETAAACVEAAIAYTRADPAKHQKFFVWARANPKSLIWMVTGVLLSQIYPHKKSFDDEKFFHALFAHLKTRGVATRKMTP